jgi:hypothetical protein
LLSYHEAPTTTMLCLQHLQQEKVASRIKNKANEKEERKEGKRNEKRCAKQKER